MRATQMQLFAIIVWLHFPAEAKACIPQNADISQMVDLFKNYVRDHPDRRHLLAANLAAEAFALAFPCRP